MELAPIVHILYLVNVSGSVCAFFCLLVLIYLFYKKIEFQALKKSWKQRMIRSYRLLCIKSINQRTYYAIG